MLRLLDDTSGRLVEVGSTRPGDWSLIDVTGPRGAASANGAALRAAILADALRRTIELLKITRARVICAADGTDGGDSLLADWRRASNLKPDPDPVPTSPARHITWTVAAVELRPAARASLFRTDDGPGDALALRWMILRTDRRRDLVITDDVIAVAEEELRAWRESVARWADQPSRRMLSEPVETAIAALCDDLRTGGAADVLLSLFAAHPSGDTAGDQAADPGALFETVAYLDRIFALELTRDIGRFG